MFNTPKTPIDEAAVQPSVRPNLWLMVALAISLLAIRWVTGPARPSSFEPEATREPKRLQPAPKTAAIGSVSEVVLAGRVANDDEAIRFAAHIDDFGPAAPGLMPATDEAHAVSTESSHLTSGQWSDFFHGLRTFRFEPDGQGCMSLELSGVGAYLYGERIEFDFAWTLSGRSLHLKMTGGRPSGTANTLCRLFGAEFDYEIDSASDGELVLKSANSGKVFTLGRPSEGAAAGPNQ